jgi:hypothetical protein
MKGLLGILIVVLVFGIMLSGCKTGEDDADKTNETKNPFEGAWRMTSPDGGATYDIEYTFTGNEFVCQVYNEDDSFAGTFSYTDTEITFTRIRSDGSVHSTWIQEYFTNGAILRLYADRDVNPHISGEFTKQ